jgi:4-hydroxybenzoate polyprenyltransferase
MAKGVEELAGFSDRFLKVAPYVIGMAIFSGIIYAMNLFGITATIEESSSGYFFIVLIGLVLAIVSIYIAYSIIMGIKEIETTRGQDLNSWPLYSAWRLSVIFSLLSLALAFIIPGLALVCIIVTFVVYVYYLFMFNKTKNLFYQENPAS